jgi:hypothetical protein
VAPLVAIAYPSLSPEDFAWIQGVRAAHDELYFGVIEPHITFVFPTKTLEADKLAAHVRAASAEVPSFDFVLRCAVVWGDATQPWWHVFLVPEEGFSAIVRLHDRLYTGPLAGELRLDIPFIPHLGIGTSQDPQACKALVDRINDQGVAIDGRIDRLDIAVLEPDCVRTIDRVELA